MEKIPIISNAKSDPLPINEDIIPKSTNADNILSFFGNHSDILQVSPNQPHDEIDINV